MYYVYLIESLSEHHQRYIGVTADLKQRLIGHNAGKSVHTAKYKPWRLVAYLAFVERTKAEAFERYLKSGSGPHSLGSACGRSGMTRAACQFRGTAFASGH
jgi:putative endonuclease